MRPHIGLNYLIMKRLLACLLLAVTASGMAAEAEWLTDYHAALNRAGLEHKFVMLDFTGSDWCGWCMKLKAEVFDQSEFAAFARENLVLVEVDFPRRKQLSADQQAANDSLAHNFDIHGYPTIILVDASGNKVGNAGYMPGGPKAFIEHLEKIPGMKHVEGVAKAEEPEPPRRAPTPFVPIPPTKPNYYNELAVKAISGAPGNRMAQINNQTLMAGESAKVHVRDTKVEVVCKEIREDSVLITVDGKPMELKLGAKSTAAKVEKTAQK
jgi:protein disulfide-isomerase